MASHLVQATSLIQGVPNLWTPWSVSDFLVDPHQQSLHLDQVFQQHANQSNLINIEFKMLENKLCTLLSV